MIVETYPEIPRIFTALAEWSACVVCILISKKRIKGIKLALFLSGALGIQCVVQEVAGMLPIQLWLFGMFASAWMMYLYISKCCKISKTAMVYYTAIAFISAEFVASFEWQLQHFIFGFWKVDSLIVQTVFLFGVYIVAFISLYWLQRHYVGPKVSQSISRKEMWQGVIISVTAFLISNISFIDINTPFSGRLAQEVFYIRTLVDLCALVTLYAFRVQHQEIQMEYEVKSMNNLLERQFQQYKQSKESIDLINRKYHDLKHQIAIIRREKDIEKRDEYLSKMENDIRSYEDTCQTGNPVLDIVLTTKKLICSKHSISLVYVINGKLLSFINAMDICAMFGNALDNAIESAKKIKDYDKRIIKVAVYSRNNLLILRFENYYNGEIRFSNGNFMTMKKDKNYHGYGLKSLKHTTEKYNGSLSINTDNNWFTLNILIPFQTDITNSK